MKALSLFFAALPFAFALFRAVRTGSDFRYFWVALAVGVFVGATLVALLAALLLGTTLGLGMLVVAASFGFCFAVAAALPVAGR